MKRLVYGCFLLAALLSLFSCGQQKIRDTETPTRGNIKIAVDESYRLMAEAQLFTFQAIYTYAHIKAVYKPEADVIMDFMMDSVRTIIVGRKLTAAEEEQLKSKQIVARTTRVAKDALAFIVNTQNPDSSILYDQVKAIFEGKISKWTDLNPKSSLGDLKVVFDHNKSSNVRYIKEKFNLGNQFPAWCFAVESNTEVVKFVENNKSALGIIGVNWISDPDDSITHSFLKKVNVLEVGDATNADGTGAYYKPYQGYVADGTYPFIREVFVICREIFAGLGTGFASFVAGEKGQRIILKGGLVPATMPIRLVQLK
jgi:phosphate transport system substrate-binding protein